MLKGNKELKKMTKAKLIEEFKKIQTKSENSMRTIDEISTKTIKAEENLKDQLESMAQQFYNSQRKLNDIKVLTDTMTHIRYDKYSVIDESTCKNIEDFRFLSCVSEMAS